MARSCVKQIRFSKAGCVLANAAPPRFEARGRLHSQSSPQVREAERRAALFSQVHAFPPPRSALRRTQTRRSHGVSEGGAARASGTPDARHPALHRGDFGPRDRASGTRTAGSSPALSRSFRPARPVPSSPCGQPHIVGADSDPSLPGAGLRAPPAGAASHPDRMTSHENALGG